MPEMRDSGCEWIGEIPIDSEVKHLKYMCDSTATSINASQIKPSNYKI